MAIRSDGGFAGPSASESSMRMNGDYIGRRSTIHHRRPSEVSSFENFFSKEKTFSDFEVGRLTLFCSGTTTTSHGFPFAAFTIDRVKQGSSTRLSAENHYTRLPRRCTREESVDLVALFLFVVRELKVD